MNSLHKIRKLNASWRRSVLCMALTWQILSLKRL